MLCCSALAFASTGTLAITPTSLPAAQVGAAYSATLTANPSNASTYTWSTTQLPDWVDFTPSGNQATLSGTPTQAGASSFSVQVSDSSNDSPVSVAYSIVVNKGAPQITWTPTPNQISFGAGLALGDQLNATAADASGNTLDGAFVYQPPAGTVLNAGTMTLTALFTPVDTTNFITATAQTSITVAPANAAIAVNDVTTVFGRAAVSLSAKVSFAVNATLLPVNGGVMQFSVADGSGNAVGNQLLANVSGGSASANFTISGLTPGAYTYTATYVPPSFGADFAGSNQTANLTINQATPAIVWSPSSSVFYNTLATTAQLNAASPLGGTFAYTDTNGASVTAGGYTFQAVGKQPFTAAFTPTDSVHYGPASATRNVSVLPDRTRVQPSDPNGNALAPAVWSAVFGDANVSLSAIVSVTTPNAAATIPTQGSVTFTVSNASGFNQSISAVVDSATGIASGSFALAGVSAGTYHVQAAFGQATLFAPSAAGGTLLVKKQAPVVTWQTPNSITYGTALDASELNASANVPGGFLYTPGTGAILRAGTGQVLHLAFRPSDSRDFSNVNTTVTIDVSPATPSLSVPTQSPPHGATQVTLVARVSSWTTVTGGKVSFTVAALAGKGSASADVINGVARVNMSLLGLQPGTYTINASYLGNSQFNAVNNITSLLTIS